MTKLTGLDQSKLHKLKGKKMMAEMLGLDFDELDLMANNLDKYYRIEEILDKKGKPRKICQPISKLAPIHKTLQSYLTKISRPDYMHYARKGRSYITNANTHINSRSLAEVDIKSFYDNTKFRHVFNFFHKDLLIAKDIAVVLTKLVTYQDSLPTGSPLSPALSQLVHMNMFNEMHMLALKNGVKFSVFGDDIVLSGKGCHKIHYEIKKIIRNNGLQYHGRKKSKTYHPHQAKNVTGVIIKNGKMLLRNKSHQAIDAGKKRLKDPNLSKKEKEKLETSLRGRLVEASQFFS